MSETVVTDPASIELWHGIEEHLSRFDLIICDLWGVMHDGVTLHKNAGAAIECARRNGVQTIFLSNAPRPREYVRNHLINMGLPKQLTDFVVTSGGLARDEVRNHFSGAKLYHMGPESDSNTIEGLPVSLVNSPDDADVILATDLAFSDLEKHREFLSVARQNDIPFLCANPDRVVHVGDRLYYCAGAVADIYTDMGGDVRWYGKPMKSAFDACLDEVDMPDINKGRVLMIGDSMKTDITGAVGAGLSSLLIAGGIHRHELSNVLNQVDNDAIPSAVFTESFDFDDTIIPTAVAEELKI
ncbi:TIGR01459 family HAD-type hydrolase [Kordiimonas sp. SCSIO 12610]|uniref:TIGR01459 family HAD-type hydrolase n=1 Tax=Kordiimonas sp. SCSIO 12610 TaxID=2829597 RepID=UPI00210E36A4|nr:TIGR01459 family HAD-type hydrolase [Kordiimonas sp. SCSIO 12610]UTW54859.1 TIGR01459 family HAD-type hydrolase [Kordiimonas sp. SCSIO 12610]